MIDSNNHSETSSCHPRRVRFREHSMATDRSPLAAATVGKIPATLPSRRSVDHRIGAKGDTHIPGTGRRSSNLHSPACRAGYQPTAPGFISQQAKGQRPGGVVVTIDRAFSPTMSINAPRTQADGLGYANGRACGPNMDDCDVERSATNERLLTGRASVRSRQLIMPYV
ncbi:hypothetical protein Poly24_37250 [Rosistilla carotiformis]|uniref:Uncharacterized protein n=1 Tax=Rosistilla carotiformis TaxID=2528017 RepID=A0A518JWV6_9BACT|nr:hypothetical protein Poly24_37250 [Rosistilla carotiformis]